MWYKRRSPYHYNILSFEMMMHVCVCESCECMCACEIMLVILVSQTKYNFYSGAKLMEKSSMLPLTATIILKNCAIYRCYIEHFATMLKILNRQNQKKKAFVENDRWFKLNKIFYLIQNDFPEKWFPSFKTEKKKAHTKKSIENVRLKFTNHSQFSFVSDIYTRFTFAVWLRNMFASHCEALLQCLVGSFF